ncbi:MAG TPA: TetR/AcrR family transcriptional regulator [Negativicutes bacterium]
MVVRPNETDPRVIRTRQLIQDAFTSLTREKEFNDITIRDITERATINRATFYAHFDDKYALLELLVSETFMTFVSQRLQSQEELTAETLRNLILAVCDYHENLSKRCKRTTTSIAPLIEMKIKMQLEDIVCNWLAKSVQAAGDGRRLEWAAVMISHSIYGVACRWNAEGGKTSTDVFVDEILPFLLAGLQTVMEQDSSVGYHRPAAGKVGVG